MKYLLFLLLVPVTFGQSIQDRVNKFEKPKDYAVSYDKFKKQTLVSFSATFKSAKYRMGDMYVSVGAFIDDGDGDVQFVIGFSRFDRQPFNRPDLRLLINGDVMCIETDSIKDHALIKLTTTQMSQLATAQNVEFQIENFESKFTPQMLLAIKNLNTLTKPQ